MKNRKKNYIFSFFWAFIALLGIILAIAHGVNSVIFRRCGKSGALKGVWKSAYGDIAFTRVGEGPPLLLIHGLGIGGGSSEWERSVSALSASRTVFALDLPGFGNSEKSGITYNSYYYVNIIADFIKKVIGEKTDALALNASSGILLASAALSPGLYKRLVIINPYGKGMGDEYKYNSLIKWILPVPIVGTLVYNYIARKQGIMSFLVKSASDGAGYLDIVEAMEKMHRNAHLYGASNKYAIISLVNGYFETSVFGLIEQCRLPLNIIVNGGSPVPMLAGREGLTLTEIEFSGAFPNINGADKLNNLILEFIDARSAV